MNVPGIKDPLRRRLHLLWIIPYLTPAIVLLTLWAAAKEFADLLRTIPESLVDVWRGR